MAQIQGYQINGSVAVNNPTQPNRPYMRWEEIVAAYYSTHVLFVDIKYATAFGNEFVSIASALPGNPQERIVAKSYGVGGNAWNTNMRAAGFKSWGYYYETDFTPANNIATNHGNFDILGLDYGASQATWDYMLSLGKPVLAHILPNAAASATALTKANASSNPGNLKGFMVSGVQSVVSRTESSV